MKEKFLEGLSYTAGTVVMVTGTIIGINVAERVYRHIKHKINEHKSNKNK